MSLFDGYRASCTLIFNDHTHEQFVTKMRSRLNLLL
jgi:hypothetical protein